MNKLLTVLFLSSMISLQAVQWLTLEEGLDKAKKTHKLLMLDVVRDNCHFCKDMINNVFNDKEMSAWIESCFIPVKLNISHEILPEGITVQVTPTFLFLNSDKKIVKKIKGSWNIKDFKKLSQKLCREY